jgi:pimeloyl-ACP methyl ester carboxylesterase
LEPLPDDPHKRADVVLHLPPHSLVDDIQRPFSTVDDLRTYMGRMLSDCSYDVRPVISALGCPILLLTGTHDAAINTAAAADVLSDYGQNVLHVRASGAGHHVQFLQYPHLRYLLDRFLSGSTPTDTARLQTTWLARQSRELRHLTPVEELRHG